MKKYTITVSKAIAGRSKEDPMYGFYWWFWLPELTSNNGKFSKNEVVDVGILWLCFSLGLIFWPAIESKK